MNRIRSIGQMGRRIFARHRWLIMHCMLGLHLGIALFGAYPVGMLEARWDLFRGRYAIRVYGYPTPAVRLATLLLPETHGIQVEWSGCLADWWERDNVRGYNSVALPAIERRIGPELLRAYGFR